MYLAPAFVLVVGMSLWPLITLFRMSLSQVGPAEIVLPNWPFIGLKNFADVLNGVDFRPALRITAIFVIVCIICTILGGMFNAAVLERDSRTNLVVQGLLVFLWALPPLVIGFIWKFLLASDGPGPSLLAAIGIGGGRSGPQSPLTNDSIALLAVAGVVSWIGAAFASLIFRASILGIDRSQVEAAVVDGATTWQVFRFITAPALRPVIAVQALFTTIYCFRAFDLQYVMTAGGPGNATTTLPFLVYKESFGTLDFSHGSAVAVLSLIFVGAFGAIYIRISRNGTD